jgi:hypothetical protein
VGHTITPGAESRRAREVAELYSRPDAFRFVALMVLAVLFAGLWATFAYLDSAAGSALHAICERAPDALCDAARSVRGYPDTEG